MISRSGYACEIQTASQTAYFGTGDTVNMRAQSLLSNGLQLFDSLPSANTCCAYMAKHLANQPVLISPIWFNFRIAESEGEREYLRLQKTIIVIGLSRPAPNLRDCALLGRYAEDCTRVTDALADLFSNGMRTFSDFGRAIKAREEYKRQTQSEALLSSFWFRRPKLPV